MYNTLYIQCNKSNDFLMTQFSLIVIVSQLYWWDETRNLLIFDQIRLPKTYTVAISTTRWKKALLYKGAKKKSFYFLYTHPCVMYIIHIAYSKIPLCILEYQPSVLDFWLMKWNVPLFPGFGFFWFFLDIERYLLGVRYTSDKCQIFVRFYLTIQHQILHLIFT